MTSRAETVSFLMVISGKTQPLSSFQQSQLAMIRAKLAEGAWKFAPTICPVCKADAFAQLGGHDRYGLEIPTAACKTCGLIQTAPRLRDADYADFYAHHYRNLYGGDPEASDDDFARSHRRGRHVAALLAKHVRPAPNSSLIEVGSGSGGLLQAFSEQGYSCTGLELDDRYGGGQAQGRPFELIGKSLHDFHPSRPPALIVYNRVLEHVLDLPKELARIRELIGDDGHLFVSVPDLRAILDSESPAKLAFLNYVHIAHLYHFSLPSLTNLMRVHGFEPVFRLKGGDSLWRKAEPGPYAPVWLDARLLSVSQRHLAAWAAFNRLRGRLSKLSWAARRALARWRGRR